MKCNNAYIVSNNIDVLTGDTRFVKIDIEIRPLYHCQIIYSYTTFIEWLPSKIQYLFDLIPCLYPLYYCLHYDWFNTVIFIFATMVRNTKTLGWAKDNHVLYSTVLGFIFQWTYWQALNRGFTFDMVLKKIFTKFRFSNTRFGGPNTWRIFRWPWCYLVCPFWPTIVLNISTLLLDSTLDS